jgi:ABC-type lipoprotein release transport system permease subunit
MFWSSLLLALRAIRRNLLRSFLTILGIVIGVGAVITMVTLGNGATRVVADQIGSLGSNLIIIRPGQQLGPMRDGSAAPRFKVADAEAIAGQIGGIKGGRAGCHPLLHGGVWREQLGDQHHRQHRIVFRGGELATGEWAAVHRGRAAGR